MKTKERELANKIAAHWYDNLHMQHAPIFQKQKLADYVETELKTLGLFSVSKPKGTFVPNEVKLPKEPRPIDMNTKYLRDKMLGTNDC